LSDQLVIALIDEDGAVDDSVLHLPADSKEGWVTGAGHAHTRIIYWADHDDAPLTWPSACGDVQGTAGFVYRRGGLLEHKPVCNTCVFVSSPAEAQRRVWRETKRKQRAKKVEPRVCLNPACRREFTPSKFQKSALYCSVECRQVVYAVKRRRNTPIRPRTCANPSCGHVFTPGRQQQSAKFCSVFCRTEAYKKLRPQRRAA
jgi:hypothetical protein